MLQGLVEYVLPEPVDPAHYFSTIHTYVHMYMYTIILHNPLLHIYVSVCVYTRDYTSKERLVRH